MPGHLLNRDRIDPSIQHIADEGAAKIMRRDILDGSLLGSLEQNVHHCLVVEPTHHHTPSFIKR